MINYKLPNLTVLYRTLGRRFIMRSTPKVELSLASRPAILIEDSLVPIAPKYLTRNEFRIVVLVLALVLDLRIILS